MLNEPLWHGALKLFYPIPSCRIEELDKFQIVRGALD